MKGSADPRCPKDSFPADGLLVDFVSFFLEFGENKT